MKPHLVRWDKDYGAKGLTVVYVNDGAADSLEDLKPYMEKLGAKFPVLWDKDSANVKTYGVEGMPAAFLIGVDGKVIWEGMPVPKVAEIEKLIQEELAKVKK